MSLTRSQTQTPSNASSFESRDEVDFIPKSIHPGVYDSNEKSMVLHKQNSLKDANHNRIFSNTQSNLMKKLKPGTLYGDCETKICPVKSSLEKFSFFSLTGSKKRSNLQLTQNIVKSLPEPNKSTVAELNKLQLSTSNQCKSRFVKSASIARFLGNTYNTKKVENEIFKLKYNENSNNNLKLNDNSNNKINGATAGVATTTATGVSTNKKCRERFQKCSSFEDDNFSVSQNTGNYMNNSDNSSNINKNSNSNNNNHNNNNGINSTNTFSGGSEVNLQDFQDDDLLSVKAFRTISRSLGKLWWKKTHSVDISSPDPEYKVSYLGNVLTGWAKGEGCVEKPLNTLWRNYTQNNKPDVVMRIKVCASGLKATTRQHGLTEYWANRVTHCCSPKNYPKVFCWIYRHEGRKLKHELRCHAVLCNKESIALDICNMLRDNLDQALRDFKREKLLKQNARLSLANSVYENPSLPRRKILLSVGGNNYRPPMERSKSAPKLMAIEEAIGEEEGEDFEETNEPEMASCCQKDSLYPAMTLGRRRCRRGHSIRRTGNSNFKNNSNANCNSLNGYNTISGTTAKELTKDLMKTRAAAESVRTDNSDIMKKSDSSLLGSDDDDFEKLLSCNNYNPDSPLAGELLSYFDMKLMSKSSSLTNLDKQDIEEDHNVVTYEPLVNTNRRPRAALSLDNLDTEDEEESIHEHYEFETEDELFYRQSAILSLLHRNSLRKLANLSIDSEDGRELKEQSSESKRVTKEQKHLDSDEGSISSGCETASTATTNVDDSSLKYVSQTSPGDNSPMIEKAFHQRSISNPIDDSDEIKTSTASMIFNLHKIPRRSSSGGSNSTIVAVTRKDRGNSGGSSSDDRSGDISDSELSDESGYVEFQDKKSTLKAGKKETITTITI